MSPRKHFDRFMVDIEVGHNLKLAHLTAQEKWCHIAGVLALAAKSPVRGFLLIGDMPAGATHIAKQADVSTAVASATVRKLREVGVLVHDDDMDCDRVHDWEDWNPAPRRDDTAADRQRRRREKVSASRPRHAHVTHPVTDVSRRDNRDGHADVTPTVTPPEVEGEERKTPLPPDGGTDGQGSEGGKVVRFGSRPVPKQRLVLAEVLLDWFNEKAGTRHPAYTGRGGPSSSLQRIIGALTDRPEVAEADWLSMVSWRLQVAPPFWTGKPDTGVAFGPGVLGANLESAAEYAQRHNPTVDAERRRKLLEGAG